MHVPEFAGDILVPVLENQNGSLINLPQNKHGHWLTAENRLKNATRKILIKQKRLLIHMTFICQTDTKIKL